MRKLSGNKFNSLFLLLVLGLSACSPVGLAPSAQYGMPTEIIAGIIPAAAPAIVITPIPSSEFDSAQAFAYNQTLAVSIGTRVAGSPSGAKAGDYIAQEFSKDGYAVERQAFDFQMWQDRSTVVKMTVPEEKDLDAKPIQNSPPGKIEAELAVVRGQGTETDFANVDVTGKIALVPRGTLLFADKAKNAANAGALAIIIYNNQSGLFTGALRDRASIPVLSLSDLQGQALIEQASKGVVKLSIASDTAFVTQTGYNIIGTQKGTSGKLIVLGGHYDSVQAGPGANDNGSGVAVLLELARDLAHQDHPDTLILIAFDGEEFGLLGSQYYVSQLQTPERSRIKAMLNFDMLGAGSGPLLAGGDGPIGQQARDLARSLGLSARNFSLGSNAGSDHEPFQRAGIDTVFFSRDYTLLHTPQDTIDQVKPEYLDEAGKVALRLVNGLEAVQ